MVRKDRPTMPALGTSPAIHRTVVGDRREPGPGIVVLGLEAPRLAAAVRPGQFAMAVAPDGGQTSTALGIYESEGRRISLMLLVVGPRTRALAELETGATLDLMGPLGNGFDLAALGDDVAVVAGGVGIASLYLAVEDLVRSGRRVRLFYGARSAPALVDSERFAALGAELELATDDGSRGHRGFVTDLLRKPQRSFSGIAACGPSPMLRAVGRIAGDLGIPAQLALEETFACGVGACWGCVVAKRAGSPDELIYVRICKEGPVFWAHELRW